MAETTLPSPFTVLGFDFGSKRIGLAFGQSLTGTASPIKPINARDGIPDWDELSKILAHWQPDALVVGIPLNMDGSVSEMARRARKFANRLHERFKLPCFLADERLTTREAKAIHLGRGGSSHFSKDPVDALAAQLIVESWLTDGLFIPAHTRLEDL
ncbi:Holliday junction resolvase [Pokkaliibacter plantistimulans]|uniref:Putative pre-16S rRNA nuclease n=2 Tax=Pseudomonadota TaxID=1224 RepID=A0ABX5LS31_9GAMM|nr:Holliday junction resolvase RuvX [Pokkaliibacter plantistimulans]PPC78341.1 Holliday junction resolvase RuvX [Pokkaliibacter plantistimulans]PXF29455.1 Holliday junction resolvase [Pokkaliibacter plantistimulans]